MSDDRVVVVTLAIPFCRPGEIIERDPRNEEQRQLARALLRMQGKAGPKLERDDDDPPTTDRA